MFDTFNLGGKSPFEILKMFYSPEVRRLLMGPIVFNLCVIPLGNGSRVFFPYGEMCFLKT